MFDSNACNVFQFCCPRERRKYVSDANVDLHLQMIRIWWMKSAEKLMHPSHSFHSGMEYFPSERTLFGNVY